MVKNEIVTDLLHKLQEALHPSRVLRNEPLCRHTTFRIGGPADYLLLPTSSREVAMLLALANTYRMPVTILGNGSNVLVRDGGIRGMVIKFGSELATIRHEGSKIIAGAGVLLREVSSYASEQGLTGLEFAIGIPGSLGGAVFMNAGAYEGEMSCVVNAVEAVSPTGIIEQFQNGGLEFRYRHSVFQDNHYAICQVEMELQLGNNQGIKQKMVDFTTRRENKQPVELPSAGSTFKRPPGYFAGTLIEQAGLKGLKIGGAQVSLKHAGFVVNMGGAAARDVLAVIAEVQRQVMEKFGVALQPEIRILGED